MATSVDKTISNKKRKDVTKLQRELFKLMLKKANLTEKDLEDSYIKLWMNQNLDLLTKNELEKYKSLFL